MKLYRFDPAAGMPIDAYGSSFALARLARSDGTALRAACFHLQPGGEVGRHRTGPAAGGPGPALHLGGQLGSPAGPPDRPARRAGARAATAGELRGVWLRGAQGTLGWLAYW
jgi:hypothetical protein